MNGANEEAVNLFLEGKIRFCDILRAIENCLEKVVIRGSIDVDNILYADRRSRECVRESFGFGGKVK